MEDGNIVVVDGEGSDKREPPDQPRRWWLPALTLIGLVAAIFVVVSTQRPTDELADIPPEASPVVTTTTTTITQSTTTAIDVGPLLRRAAAFMVSDVKDFCVRASPFTNEGEQPIGFGGNRVLAADEWTESLNQDDWYLNHGDFLEAFEQYVSEAGAAMDRNRSNLLDSVVRQLHLADEALHDALQALDEGEPDPSWAYHIARIENSCARANGTLTAILTMSAE